MSGRYERYAISGAGEWLFVHGPPAAPQVLIVPPLFEELNFTRTLLVGLARGLAARGFGAAILDLPGTGESELTMAEVDLADWRGAVAAAARHLANRSGGLPHMAAVRGGALLDDAAEARSWWRFAPVAGAALVRQMERAQAIGDRESGAVAQSGDTIELVGYDMRTTLRDAVRGATASVPPGPLREVPFAGPGVGLWRRAEPASDPALAEVLADDLAAWIG